MIEKMMARQWQDVIDVHLTGTFFWTQAVGRHMLDRVKNGGDKSGGSIVNISSDAGRKGSIGQINYAAAKAGNAGHDDDGGARMGQVQHPQQQRLLRRGGNADDEVVRGDKFRDGILNQIPMGRWAQPEEVVKTVCFCCPTAPATSPGQHLAVNGGFHISL